jgi:hypothetical protein
MKEEERENKESNRSGFVIHRKLRTAWLLFFLVAKVQMVL